MCMSQRTSTLVLRRDDSSLYKNSKEAAGQERGRTWRVVGHEGRGNRARPCRALAAIVSTLVLTLKRDGKPPECFKQISDVIWIVIGQDGSGPDVEKD